MQDAKAEPTFEDMLAALEKRVAKMESGELPLEEMIKEFESGSKLLKSCRSRLEALEKKVEILTRDDGAAGQWAEFDPSEGARVRPAATEVENTGSELPF